MELQGEPGGPSYERNKIKILLRSKLGIVRQLFIWLNIMRNCDCHNDSIHTIYAAISGLPAGFAGFLKLPRKRQRSISADDSGVLSGSSDVSALYEAYARRDAH